MITLTVVRHGESTDNLKPLWAGWSNAPLSVHGMNQAKALGESLQKTHVDAIYASDLQRALWTAQQIERHQEPRPQFTVSPLLREQNFGAAEHKPFGKDYIRGTGRTFKFDDGESLEDVRGRANEAIAKFIERHFQECNDRPPTCRHIVVVAHGIFNAEFIGALLARRRSPSLDWGYKGDPDPHLATFADEAILRDDEYRLDTDGGRIRGESPSRQSDASDPLQEDPSRSSTPRLVTDPEGPRSPSSEPSEPPPMNNSRHLPSLHVRIVSTDVTKHLDGVHRQKGGIGNQGYDSSQKDLRAFFSGAK